MSEKLELMRYIVFTGDEDKSRKRQVCKSSSSKGNMSRDMRFPQCGILTSVGSGEAVQPPFKLRNSKWCSVSSLALIK